jgi:tetratricopeptide (TPR) repeat protein
MMVNTALEYLDNLSKSAHGDPDLQWELAEAYEKVADAQGSPTAPSLGKSDDALKSYRKSIALQEDLLRQGLLDGDRRVSLAQTYIQLANVYRGINQPLEAVRAAEEGVRHAGAVSEKARMRALTTLALAQTAAGNPVEALKINQSIEAAFIRDAENEKGWDRAHNSLAALDTSIARSLVRLGRFDESIPYYGRSIEIREQRLAEPAFDTVNARELIVNYQSLADVLGAGDRFSMGKTAEAVVWYRKALDLSQRMTGGDAKNATARIEVARSAGKFGAAIQKTDPAQALALFRKALTESEDLLPPGPQREEMRASAYRSMAVPLRRLGRADEARQKLDISFRIDEEALKRNPNLLAPLSSVTEDWLTRGDLETADRPAAAAEAYRKGLELADRAAALAPSDIGLLYSQVRALEGLIALQGRNDAANGENPRARMIELFEAWSRRQPDSTFVQQRLRKLR